MAFLVTGGAGFIGSHTCVELLNSGNDIIVIDNFSNSNPEVIGTVKDMCGRDFKHVACDVRDKKTLRAVFRENEIEGVLHFAGYKAVGESVLEPLKYYDNNVFGTCVLLEAMREAGCKKLIFSSSATVYGMPEQSPITEEFPLGAINPYGSTKLVIEGICRDLCRSDDEWSIALLRYFNPIGAHESGRIGEDPNGIPNNLMPIILHVATGKIPNMSVYGNDYPTPDGTGVRDYLHVVDLALGHVAAINYVRENKGAEAFNLGTGKGYSVLEIINAFESANSVKIPYVVTGRREGDIAECFADPSKTGRVLGWRAERGLEQMCRDAWRFAAGRG